MTIAGLIFDCDGVLIDSEPLSAIEFSRILRELSLPIDEDQVYDRYLGRSVASIADIIRDQYAVDISGSLPLFRDRLAARFDTALRPIPGIAEALDCLSLPRAVASSSLPERLEHTLKLTGLWDRFAPHVYSGSMVQHSKPAPDLFLFAARKLGLRPETCVVIEDSPAGVHAARAAGMRVIGFLGGSHAERALLPEKLRDLQPDALIEHASELPETLERLAQRS